MELNDIPPHLGRFELKLLTWTALVLGVAAWWRLTALFDTPAPWTSQSIAWLAGAVLLSIAAGVCIVLTGLVGVEERLRRTRPNSSR